MNLATAISSCLHEYSYKLPHRDLLAKGRDYFNSRNLMMKIFNVLLANNGDRNQRKTSDVVSACVLLLTCENPSFKIILFTYSAGPIKIIFAAISRA